MTRSMIAILALGLTTLPAFALDCTFTTECFEGDGCADTQFTAEIVGTDEGGALFITDAETVPLSQGGSPETRVYVGITQSAFHVITHSVEGAARYSTHIYSGPLMVNYLGTCE